VHRGVLVEEQGVTYLAERDGDGDDARALTGLQAAACTYRIAWGPGAGQTVASLQGALQQAARLNLPLCVTAQGFSLHAAVRCGSDNRQVVEQLCRYITRPALANERVRCNRAGQVLLKLRPSGATAPPTLSCRRCSSCSGSPRWRNDRAYT